MAQRDYTDIADTVFAAGHEERHPVSGINLPGLGGDVQQPAFRDDAVENREHHFFLVGLLREGHRGTERLGVAPVQIVCVIYEVEALLIFREDSAEDVLYIDSGLFHNTLIFTGPSSSPKRART